MLHIHSQTLRKSWKNSRQNKRVLSITGSKETQLQKAPFIHRYGPETRLCPNLEGHVLSLIICFLVYIRENLIAWSFSNLGSIILRALLYNKEWDPNYTTLPKGKRKVFLLLFLTQSQDTQWKCHFLIQAILYWEHRVGENWVEFPKVVPQTTSSIRFLKKKKGGFIVYSKKSHPSQ